MRDWRHGEMGARRLNANVCGCGRMIEVGEMCGICDWGMGMGWGAGTG